MKPLSLCCLLLLGLLMLPLARADTPPAQRIVTLAPHLAELVVSAGAQNRLVGVSEHSRFVPGASALPVVSGPGYLNREALLKLKPDLVLVWKEGSRFDELDALSGLGLKVEVLASAHLSDVPGNLRRIGVLSGTTDQAEPAARAFEQGLQALRSQYAQRRPVSVFFQLWPEPLLTINQNHIIHEVLALCGGRNVYQAAPMLVPTATLEGLAKLNPEVIMLTREQAGRQPWEVLKVLKAVHQKQVYRIDDDAISRPSTRILDGVGQICTALDQARKR